MPGAYDQVRYWGLPVAQAHPDRLATIGTLFGMAPAPPSACRVLELGCTDGGNLIPMALGFPESRFVGLDLAEQAVAEGRRAVTALGLRNIDLRQGDLMDAATELGEFDYIIAHGLYSWVPERVRERLLHICRANLAPHGVAYVSYNVYPGFHSREMFREMLLGQVKDVQDPVERVRKAVEFLQGLAEHQPASRLTQALLAEELNHFSRYAWWYLYHDDLAPLNHAVYFHEFMAHAGTCGLQYLGEAEFPEMQSYIYPEPMVECLHRFAEGDAIRMEQYLDFIKGRHFRQTLLCRSEVALDREPRPGRLTAMYFASAATAVAAAPDLREGALEEFRGPRDAALQTGDRQVKTALVRLQSVWPQSVAFADLLTHAGGAAEALAEALLHAHSAGLLEVSIRKSQFAAQPGERPVASRFAQLQAERGNVVTTLRHMSQELDDVDRRLVGLLDGTHDRRALTDALAMGAETLEIRLAWLAKQALLVA